MSSSTFSSKSVLNAYGLAAVLVVAAHFWVASSDAVWSELYRLSVPMRDDALRLETNLRFASRDGADSHIILMGSSQTREDFDVEYLNQRFEGGERFLNLGFSGNGNPIEIYMLTPRVIEVKPNLVIYTPFIGSLFFPYEYETFDRYFDPNILPLIIKIHGWGEVADNSNAVAWGYIRRLSVFARFRVSYRAMLDDALLRWVTDAPPKVSETFAYHERKPESHFRDLIEAHENRPRYHEHPHRALYQASFHMMAQTLKEQNIPLLVVDGPTLPSIQYFYHPALDVAYDEFMSTASTTHGFTYLPASELPKFDVSEFNDFTHLNAEGRARFSAFIADYLQENAARLGLTER